MWREGAGAGAGGDSPAMAEKASASVQSLTKALRVAERKQPMILPAASLPGRCLRQLLSLSMSLTAHRPCFFRKLFFPSSLSMETQNSNRKEKKKRKNSQAPSGPAKPSPGSALTRRPGTGRALGASETAFSLRTGVFQFRKAGFPQALEFILPLVTWWLKHGPLSLVLVVLLVRRQGTARQGTDAFQRGRCWKVLSEGPPRPLRAVHAA